MNIRCIFLLSLLIYIGRIECIAQEKPLVLNLSGVIKDPNDKPLPFVKVIVRNSKEKDVSNLMGMFSVVVRNTDTIYIVAEGYEKLRIVIRDTFRMSQICVDIKMNPDTMPEQVAVFPYKTYEEFKNAVLKLRLTEQDKDMENARKNIALVNTFLLMDNSPNSAANFKATMQEQYDKLYYKGQIFYNPLFNVLNWSKFIEALKRGDFRNSRDLPDFD